MIPDPIELMESRQARLIFDWDKAQRGVPAGAYRCPYCQQIFSYEPIQMTSAPDSPACCYDCLPPNVKKAYDEFFWKETGE